MEHNLFAPNVDCLKQVLVKVDGLLDLRVKVNVDNYGAKLHIFIFFIVLFAMIGMQNYSAGTY